MGFDVQQFETRWENGRKYIPKGPRQGFRQQEGSCRSLLRVSAQSTTFASTARLMFYSLLRPRYIFISASLKQIILSS